jgi:nitronate monooxygenase
MESTPSLRRAGKAGGHRGMFLFDDIDAQPGLISLLPQVRDAVRLPVVAAGGISDGRGIAAAFALGADAVQVGTAYLRTPEATISPMHRAALARARDDATRLTNVFTGRPARGLINRFVAEVGPMCEDAPQFPLAAGAAAPLRSAAEQRGSGDFSPLWAGESAALAREESAEALTRRLWADGQAAMSELSRRVER